MTKRRLFLHMVTKNEADRYLGSMLRWHAWVDDVHVYDDRSTDDTAIQAHFRGAEVEVRGVEAPSFMEHEGQFRQAAWNSFEMMCEPLLGDWVLLLDADEFLVCDDARESVEAEIDRAEDAGVTCVRLRIHEVFATRAVVPLIRTDGYWPTIEAPRLVRYQPGGRFPNKEMACGSAPTYVFSTGVPSETLNILHFGYATEGDRIAKYSRYVNKPGHNRDHVESILRQPRLEPWSGRIPIL